ncbi:MAG: cob(I)yrinic acid a,c-diamide adenosyltransferase [Halofilum sp. (in: g-proteobacteria)]|nr:cob(I)yrinic acid a,c-diamide adenosyltransferase [Halofilum sp. (in: g-proteobacteria)]
MSEPESDAEYEARMREKKAAIDRKVAEANESRGIVIVLTGDGKGKSSSAFGTLARAIGHGYTGGVVQFIKGTWDAGDHRFFGEHPSVEYHVMGTGFTWETRDREKDRQAAVAAWEHAEHLLEDESRHLVVLDEITYVIKYGHLDVQQVVEAIEFRPRNQSVILTGRNAQPELIELADTVSEVCKIKHAFEQGIKAQPGIEF